MAQDASGASETALRRLGTVKNDRGRLGSVRTGPRVPRDRSKWSVGASGLSETAWGRLWSVRNSPGVPLERLIWPGGAWGAFEMTRG